MLHAARRVQSIREQSPSASDQAAPIRSWKHRYFEQAVPQVGSGKEPIAPAVEPAVSDQDQFAGDAFLAARDDDLGFGFRHGLAAGNDVSKGANSFLLFPIDQFNG